MFVSQILHQLRCHSGDPRAAEQGNQDHVGPAGHAELHPQDGRHPQVPAPGQDSLRVLPGGE